MVLIAGIDPDHSLHTRSMHHLRSIANSGVYVPSAALIEFDFELKTHGFSPEERREASTALLGHISNEKILPVTLEILIETTRLEPIAGYFDGLIGATAKVYNITKVISKDSSFQKMNLETEW